MASIPNKRFVLDTFCFVPTPSLRVHDYPWRFRNFRALRMNEGNMPNHRALAIANEFIKLNEPMPMSSQMWLQKLVYIAQGWNLAINDEPLVREDVQAWDQGPVFRSIWDHIRDYGVDRKSFLLINPSTSRPYTADLSEDERAVIKHVWRKYRDFTGKELSVKTHKPGTPWTITYLDEGRNSEISKALIRRHYRTLAAAGRDRAEVHP